jgi:hypothetical protein
MIDGIFAEFVRQNRTLSVVASDTLRLSPLPARSAYCGKCYADCQQMKFVFHCLRREGHDAEAYTFAHQFKARETDGSEILIRLSGSDAIVRRHRPFRDKP